MKLLVFSADFPPPITTGHSPGYPPEVLQGILDFMIKPLLRTFSDSVEKCREHAIGIMAE